MINLHTTRGSCTVGDEISLLSQTSRRNLPRLSGGRGAGATVNISLSIKRVQKTQNDTRDTTSQHRGIKSGEKMNTRRHKSITEKHKHTTSTQRHHKESTHFVSLETRVVSHDGLIMSRSHAGTQLCTFSSYYRHTVRCREDATLTSLQEQVSCLQGTLMQ